MLNYYGALFNGHHNKDLVDTGKPFIPDNLHLQDFLFGLGKLSPQSQADLIKDLAFDEVEYVIKHDCDYNKSPGLDGLPYELYKATWDIIGKDFSEVLKVQMVRFRIIESDRHGQPTDLSDIIAKSGTGHIVSGIHHRTPKSP